MPKFRGPEDGVDSYYVWKQTRNIGCLCDWCKFRWSGSITQVHFCDWLKPEWGLSSLNHNPGDPVTEFACCVQVEAHKAGGFQFYGPNIYSPTLSQPDALKELALLKDAVAVVGHNCSRCNSRNEYAASNQKDGSYVCFDCR